MQLCLSYWKYDSILYQMPRTKFQRIDDVFWLLLAASAFSAWSVFKADSERLAAIKHTVKFSDRGSGFMALHANITKTLAFAAEYIGNELNGMDSAILREQSHYTGFGRVAGQISHK